MEQLGGSFMAHDETEGKDRCRRHAKNCRGKWGRVFRGEDRPPFSTFCLRTTSPSTEVNGHLHSYDQCGSGEHLRSASGRGVVDLEGATASLASAVLFGPASEIDFPSHQFWGYARIRYTRQTDFSKNTPICPLGYTTPKEVSTCRWVDLAVQLQLARPPSY